MASNGVTRRRALGAGAAALLAYLAPRASRAVAQPVDGPGESATFAMDVLAADSRRVRGAGVGAFVTPVLAAPERFDLVGLTWPRGIPLSAEIRTRGVGGRWSRWVPAGAATGHDADGEADQAAGEPLWSGLSDAIQLRLSHRLDGLRAHFVRVSGPATGVQRLRGAMQQMRARLAAASSDQHPGAPPIVPRDAWADAACRPRSGPAYGDVHVAFVHHTEGTNVYRPNESPAIVRAVCRFHQDVRGWNDIGYNFLVDRFGQIFEGRAGGIDAAVIGAQAGGFNADSTGVAVMGSFTSAPAPSAALEALARLLAWKLRLHATPERGLTRVRSAGGASTDHPRGSLVTLQRIAGHRDADSTTCPGNGLYAQLPALRAAVGARAAPLPMLSAHLERATLTSGELARLSGMVRLGDGSPAGNTSLAIQVLRGSAYATVTDAHAGPDGHWAVDLPMPANGLVRAWWSGDRRAPATASSALAVQVSPVLTARLSQSEVRPGANVALSGTITPAKARLELRLERRARGRWRVELKRRLPARDGRFTAGLRLARAGSYRVRVRFSGDRNHGPAELVLAVAARGAP